MVRSRFAQGLDTFLFVVASSFIVFAWVNKYLKLTWASIIITAIISFVAAKIIWSLSTTKYNKYNLKKQELNFAQNCIDYLSLHPKDALKLFAKIIPDSKLSGTEFLISGATLYYFDYSSEQTTTATISKILGKLKTTKATTCMLFTSNISTKANNLLASLDNIKTVADYDAYIIMKEKNVYPITEAKNAKLQQKKLKMLLNMAFSPKRIKPYLCYGTLMLFISFIMPYTMLYCFVGTLFITFALICLIKKHTKKPSAV